MIRFRFLFQVLLAAIALAPVGSASSSQDAGTPGSEFQDCPECPRMVVIPAGSYGMLAPPVDQGRPYAEGELRPVTISEPFAVGKFEVTFDEWDACVRGGGCVAATSHKKPVSPIGC
jgi:formylglycine-generating enzyme required for sulfatase activity